MLTCVVCKKVIDNPELLFRHIKEEHKICGNNCKVQCTLCWKTFSNFSTFKTNVSKCFAEAVDDVEVDEDDSNKTFILKIILRYSCIHFSFYFRLFMLYKMNLYMLQVSRK